ncbi:MAG: hypothetical protein PHR92_05620, partial [Lachnospiraceae bacterium]|nr:hypothetical protein [Lachnospiraceae bacterium]
MMKHEFEAGLGNKVTEEQYRKIQFVYTWHPVISDVHGKDDIVALYKIGGDRLMLDMAPTA